MLSKEIGIEALPWRTRRKIWGASAILLPVDSNGDIMWREFEAHVQRTCQAGLVPAVNMDTGYVHLLSADQKKDVLNRTKAIVGQGTFVAGAFVKDLQGEEFQLTAYQRAIDEIQSLGGLPILFPSFGLTTGYDDDILQRYQSLASGCDEFLGFELGQEFAAFGKIFSLELFSSLLQIPNCIGLKHSSLRRDLEWQRLKIRDEIRPEFRLMTGNDLAIDMVAYGSDYLLGLSTMAPDLFALRDKMWLDGNSDFWQLNDALQYLGCFAFRNPVPAYRHSAAQFLKLQGWISTSQVYAGSLTRADSDEAILSEILRSLLSWRK